MRRENKSHHVYEEIRNLILSRTLEPGERLVERSWAEKLSVNRAAVRQALSRLAGEGLLVHGKKGGVFVPQPDPSREDEFLRARLAVEIGAAYMAVKHATKKDIAELKNIVSIMRQMTEHDMYAGFNEADMRFHEIMVRAAHSPHLLDVYHRANFPLNIGMPKSHSRLECDTEEHVKLLDALEKRNFPLLLKLLSQGQ
ncbi:MAG: GntR family transcriptional regulator [Phycisphaerae bacterium]|nr:GntR family transcriptional regulator [Phycisphaerae bacterium]